MQWEDGEKDEKGNRMEEQEGENDEKGGNDKKGEQIQLQWVMKKIMVYIMVYI